MCCNGQMAYKRLHDDDDDGDNDDDDDGDDDDDDDGGKARQIFPRLVFFVCLFF